MWYYSSYKLNYFASSFVKDLPISWTDPKEPLLWQQLLCPTLAPGLMESLKRMMAAWRHRMHFLFCVGCRRPFSDCPLFTWISMLWFHRKKMPSLHLYACESCATCTSPEENVNESQEAVLRNTQLILDFLYTNFRQEFLCPDYIEKSQIFIFLWEMLMASSSIL